MARVTAVIDIGSNSARMVVFRRTSRFGFHLLEECKARVRISEESYNNSGNLQEFAMERTEVAIGDFLKICKFHKARKILCVATSAVRDAPNKNEFLKRVRNKYGLNIKVIDGEKEAFYGGVAALNLLPIDEAVTVDIGGGSTEFAVIKDRKIVAIRSLNMGTVRIKENFFDSKKDLTGATLYIQEELEKLSSEFKCNTIIGIGGTIRSISDVIMKRDEYPLPILHGFTYKIEDEAEFYTEIVRSNREKLKKIGFKQERIDIIREGTVIFSEIIKFLGAKDVITSGVGVREGVFLADLLRNSNSVFPANFNPSIRSLIDRFDLNREENFYLADLTVKLFDVLKPIHNIDDDFKKYLIHTSKIVNIGKALNFYKRATHSYEIALYGLNYGFSHDDRVLIATILDNQQKKDLTKFNIDGENEQLLPSKEIVWWLSKILFVASSINKDRSQPKIEFKLEGKKLLIDAFGEHYISKEYINGLNISDRLELCWM